MRIPKNRTYLRHKIGKKDIKSETKKIKEFPTLYIAKSIRGFLRLTGYYRRLIPNFSKIIQFLTKLFKKCKILKLARRSKLSFFIKTRPIIFQIFYNSPILPNRLYSWLIFLTDVYEIESILSQHKID